MASALDTLRARGVVSALDEHFARTIARLAGEDDERVLLAAALASRHVGQGHVYLDLRRLERESLVDDSGEVVDIDWPDLDGWLTALRTSPCVAVTTLSPARGESVEGVEILERPLVLDDGDRLYLQRYWMHQ